MTLGEQQYIKLSVLSVRSMKCENSTTNQQPIGTGSQCHPDVFRGRVCVKGTSRRADNSKGVLEFIFER